MTTPNIQTSSEGTPADIAARNVIEAIDELIAARKAYAVAQGLTEDAWRMFDVAVDECQPNEVKNELAETAQMAEESKSARWNDLNRAYQALITPVA